MRVRKVGECVGECVCFVRQAHLILTSVKPSPLNSSLVAMFSACWSLSPSTISTGIYSNTEHKNQLMAG